MTPIVLTTLNARYHHSSFGLRYLMAQLGELQSQAVIKEFIIKKPVSEIAQELLALNPRLIGIGVYIWNAQQVLELVQVLKSIRPEVLVVLGGPEISFETETQELYRLCDFVFKGESDFSFKNFCQDFLLRGQLPKEKIISSVLPKIEEIVLPYDLYNEEDVRNRVIYVEASRGCPYKCEYCLSSLDTSVRNFPLEAFLSQMQALLDRGVRQFKFVDRTFNLSPKISGSILQFFLDRMHLNLFLHFEMVPDRLPQELKIQIQKFPKGSLQFEIGIQTWNPEVAANVSRRQNYKLIAENLVFLKSETGVHTHADLIVGLPGETLESFGCGFDELKKLGPDEIQVGILKRLKGAPINKKSEKFQMVYSDTQPFQIISTSTMSTEEIRKMDLFQSFWDRINNSGRFRVYMAGFENQLGSESFFWSFFKLAQYLGNRFHRAHSIHYEDLVDAVLDYSVQELKWAEPVVRLWLEQDMDRVGSIKRKTFSGLKRQSRHLDGPSV